MRKQTRLLLYIAFGMLLPMQVHGQDAMSRQEQLDEARQLQEAREERMGEVRIETDQLDTNVASVYDGGQRISAGESASLTPSFFVSQIRIVEDPVRRGPVAAEGVASDAVISGSIANADNVSPLSLRLIKGPLFYANRGQKTVMDVPREFSFLERELMPYIDRKVSVDEVNELSVKLNQSLLSRGYATSRIVIPEQSLATGLLQFNLQLGRIEHVRYAEGSPHLPWQNAFPLREGDVLNIRDIEQGLEQIQRLGSQSVSVALEPGTQPLYSDIVLTAVKRPPIHGAIYMDDSGLRDTGKLQWTATLGIDRLFNANDTLNIAINRDGAGEGEIKGTKNHSLSYSIPRGKDTFTLSYSHMKYHQTVNSGQIPFVSSSRSRTVKGTWQHVFHRDRTVKRSWDVSVSKRNSHNYINDVEIAVQKADTAALELGLSERRYIKRNTLYSRVAVKKGVGWFGSQPEFYGAPSTRYTQVLVDADYQIPRVWGHRPASVTTSFHGQWTTGGKRLFSRDMLSIGNRYTVQGFDGEHTLMAESGWYVRNEVFSYIPKLQSGIYLTVDFGAVYGPSTEFLTGRFISGTALGMRGRFKSGLFYDAFVGVPLYKPKGYRTDSVTAGFQAGVRF